MEDLAKLEDGLYKSITEIIPDASMISVNVALKQGIGITARFKTGCFSSEDQQNLEDVISRICGTIVFKNVVITPVDEQNLLVYLVIRCR